MRLARTELSLRDRRLGGLHVPGDAVHLWLLLPADHRLHRCQYMGKQLRLLLSALARCCRRLTLHTSTFRIRGRDCLRGGRDES